MEALPLLKIFIKVLLKSDIEQDLQTDASSFRQLSPKQPMGLRKHYYRFIKYFDLSQSNDT